MTFAELQAKHPKLFEHASWSNCPQGWLPLVARLCEQLEEKCPEVRVAQCKDKFGGLRFYCDNTNDAADALIDAAESASMTLCEKCGNLATQHSTARGWIVTRCEACKP